ncbi:S-layer homology domain-containing protein [Moorella sulfitireducens]|uniref:S-layer homology domain-containing protein n=1 Tax=Neomoorella sulfitireducens TaxID=2972948 RepID=UPI0021ACF850|nr:S-layer homology domain-containing protein [Moorella sulfitireducens]
MQKRHEARRFLVAFSLFLIIIFFNNQALAASSFLDVTNNHWAVRYISKISAMGIAGGYTDGTFRPDQSVTEVEAVLMALRCMGDSATSTTTVPFNVPEWARQDVARALDLGLVKSYEDFYPEAAATRAWVTRLLVRMIGKEEEALNNNATTAFKDSYSIPSWASGYVQVAQANKLVSGYPDNTFRPDAAVTRAEMAALLGRALDMLPDSGRLTQGRVLEVTLDRLTVSTAAGGTRTFRVSYDLPAYDENGPISLLALERLDKVSLVIDGDRIKYLEKLAAEPATAVVKGSIRKIYQEMGVLVLEVTGGEYRTFYLPADGDIPVSGAGGGGLAALQPGDEVEIILDAANYVTSISVISRQQRNINEGIVYDLDVDNYLITLQGDSGSLVSYRLADEVNVIIEGQRFSTIKDIKRGDRVRLAVENFVVTAIEVLEAYSLLDITGTVITVAPANGVLTLEVDGQPRAFWVADDVRGILENVADGDQVQARVEKGIITLLEIKGYLVQDRLTGTVVGIDTGNRVLTLLDAKKNLRAYKVKDNARIVIDGEGGTLSAVKKDMQVTVQLIDQEIIYIEVDNSVSGTVVFLDDTGLYLILQDEAGQRKTYVLAKNVDIESRDGRDEVDEIKRGDFVKLTLDGATVTGIKLQAAFILRVEDIRESWDRIDAEDEDGITYRLYIRDGAELVVPGVDYPEVEDVREGDMVRATYMGEDLVKVEVLQPRQGEVTALNANTRTVSLKYFSGTAATIDFRPGSEVIAGSKKYDTPAVLTAGDRVQVVENLNGGYTFKVMQQATGTLAADADVYLLYEDGLTLQPTGTPWLQKTYDVAGDVYIHKAGSPVTTSNLKKGQQVRIYLLDDMVYEIEML